MVFIRLDSSRKEVGYTLLHTVTNLKCVLTEEINFTEIYLPKSKSFIAVTLYRPQDKIDFVNCIDQISYSSKQVTRHQQQHLLIIYRLHEKMLAVFLFFQYVYSLAK